MSTGWFSRLKNAVPIALMKGEGRSKRVEEKQGTFQPSPSSILIARHFSSVNPYRTGLTDRYREGLQALLLMDERRVQPRNTWNAILHVLHGKTG